MKEDYLLKIGEVITFCNGHIYFDLSYLQYPWNGAFFYVIVNDVIMCSSIIHFPFIFFLTQISFINLQLRHKWRLSVEDRWSYYIL